MNKQERINTFKSLGFGIFVHFGLYSLTKKGEWTKCLHHVSDNEYQKLVSDFKVKDSFAKDLVFAARKAGAKYIVLTTRHHDGFSLYNSDELSDYNVLHTPTKRDLIKEFTDECRANNIVPFFYHTTIDWYNHDYLNDFPKYLEYLRKSVEILCTKYGKIGGLWFDGNWDQPDADWEEEKLYALIRKHQPDAIITNNTGLQARGKAGVNEIDCVTFERGRPESVTQSLASEMCETMGSHWGYTHNDLNYKSFDDLLTSYMLSKKHGANFLLNIGPMADGSIRKIEEGVMELFGAWNDAHKDALLPSELVADCGDDVFCLKNSLGEHYLFVRGLDVIADSNVALNLGELKEVTLNNFDQKCAKVFWIDNNEALEFSQDKNLCITCTNFRYGTDFDWRVAKIIVE